MKLSRLPPLALVLACGSAQALAQDAAEVEPADDGLFAIRIDPDGRVVVDAPRNVTRGHRFYLLRPAFWPETSAVPVLGVGRLRVSDGRVVAEPWATRQVEGIESLRIEPASSLAALDESKQLVEVSAAQGGVTIGAGGDVGVREGDLYWLLDDTARADRLGDALVAMVRVTAVDDDSADAVVVHQSGDIGNVELALFAQSASGLVGEAASVRVAPFTPDGAGANVEPLRRALERFQVDYEVSNIAIEALGEFIAPEPADAAQLASESAPDDAFGMIAFGREADGAVIFNATAFGVAPHGASTVGILPGGLTVPAESADAFVAQIAPSIIAGVLAQRDEHALAAYLLENELRRDDLQSAVRYHLREHLALRYEALGLDSEALSLMSADIESAREDGDRRAQLNALSIRTLLDLRAGLTEQLLADATEFLDVAAGELDAQHLGAERLLLADARLRNGDVDGAIALIREVLQGADESENTDLAGAAAVDLAYALRFGGDASAGIAISELLDRGERLRPSARVALDLAAADLYAADGDGQRAMESLERAVETASAQNDPALAAAVFARCGAVFETLGELEAASEAYLRASEIFLGRGQSADAGDFITRSAFAAIGSAGQHAGQDGLRLLVGAYEALSLAGELAIRRGDTLEAAQALLVVSMIQDRLGSDGPAEAMLLEALELGRRSAHASTIIDAYERLAELAERRGDIESSLAYRGAALRWSTEAGGAAVAPATDDVPSY